MPGLIEKLQKAQQNHHEPKKTLIRGENMETKNLLFITSDQWRGECLSALGHPTVKTPNLDALAADGVVFRNHFAQCTPCGPSRASIFTGMYLQNHRSVTNGTPLDARHTNMALEFRKLGYDPALVGYTDTTPDLRLYPPYDPVHKTYEGILPGFHRVLAMPSENFPEPWAQWLEERGYDVPENARDLYYESVKGYPGAESRGKTYAPAPYSKEQSETAFVTDKAEKFLRRPGHRPWFLHISYLKPHRPYLATEPYNSLYHPDDVPDFRRAPSVDEEAKQHPFLANLLEESLNKGYYRASIYPRDEKSMRQVRATYYGLMTEVDDNIGKLVALLKETGQYENTVIVFVSDHGVQLGDHHLIGIGSYFDQTLHIPLIIRAPDEKMQMQRDRVVDAFTENVDILPTLLDIFGADIPMQCDGRSLVPFLLGGTPKKWRTEVHWEVDFRYKEGLDIDFEASSFNVIRDNHYKYVYFAAMPPLLFDLNNDPDELHNLAGDPSYTETVLKYTQKMLSWRMVNDERTLSHILVSPEGATERPRSLR
jgi:arylsulfatase A-like enzyme